jgi:hypothetical protein
MCEEVEHTPEGLADGDLAAHYSFLRQQYTVEEVMAWYIECQQRTFTRIATAWQEDILKAVKVRDSIGAAL